MEKQKKPIPLRSPSRVPYHTELLPRAGHGRACSYLTINVLARLFFILLSTVFTATAPALMLADTRPPAIETLVFDPLVLADAGAPAVFTEAFLPAVLADARAVAVLALALLAAVLALAFHALHLPGLRPRE